MQTEVILITLVAGIWLSVLSYFVYKIYALFNKLSRGVEVSDLKKVLENLISDESQNKKEMADINRKIEYLTDDGRFHIQKLGLTRFNPFKELGGDHSFSLAILDANDSGIIITSLHTRDRTRVYMKDIKKGKSSSELAAEERKALSIAQKK